MMQNDINMPCSGCMLYFPNNKTIELTEHIYNSKTSSENDQIILRNYLHNDKIRLNLLPIEQFPNGLLYFNDFHSHPYYKSMQIQFKKSQTPVFFVHANFMVGINTKIDALKSKNLWYLL